MKLYWCRITPWRQNPALARAFCRRAGIDVSAIWDDRDLASHAAGRWLLSCAWREAVPDRPMPPIERIGEGKPVFSGAAPFHWNLSHAGDLAVCAVSSLPVGVDVEERTAVDAALFLRLPPEEQRWCAHQSDAFFTLWTAKESLVKSRGEGLAALLALPPLVREGKLCLQIEDCFWQPVSILPGYAAAVASPEAISDCAVAERFLPLTDEAGSSAAQPDGAEGPAPRR